MPIRLSLTSHLVFPCLLLLWIAQCSLPARDATFPKNPDSIERGEFVGPFTGTVKDSKGNTLSDVKVILTWKLTHNKPSTEPTPKEESIVVTVTTGDQGSYAIPALKPPKGTKVTEFRLIAYKFGFIAYRSDMRFEDRGTRQDFVQKDHLIFLTKTESGLNHEEHLSFLQCNPTCAEPMRTILSTEISEAERQASAPSPTPTVTVQNNIPEPTATPVPETTIAPFLKANELLSSVLSELKGLPSDSPLDVATLFNILPFPDAVTQKEEGPDYASVYFKSLKELEQGRHDIAIRLWRLENVAQADALFLELKKTLDIKRVRKDKISVTGEVYDSAIHIHGIIMELKANGIVAQLSCGDRICTDKRLIKQLIAILQAKLSGIK